MRYFAYVRTNGTLRLDYAERDEARGVIGKVYDLPPPLAERDTLDAAVEAGYAYLGQHPTASICIADENSLLYKELYCRLHYDHVSSLQKHLFIAWTCFTFATLSLLATVIFGFGFAGLGLASFAIGLYLLLVRLGIYNEVESAVVCLILSTVVSFLVPAVRAAWAAYQLRNG